MLDPPDSDDLIRRAQEGDVRAFERLVEEHIPRLRRFARALAHSDADADDLAQEALIKVYRCLGGYRFESSFSTWLYQVTRNCFVDGQRRAATRTRTAAAIADAAALEPSAASEPEAALLQAEDRARLWDAIGRVALEFRTVLVLCDVEGLGLAEVAAIEKLPQGTVKSRLHRGRAQLARLLREGQSQGNQAVAANVSPMEGRNYP